VAGWRQQTLASLGLFELVRAAGGGERDDLGSDGMQGHGKQNSDDLVDGGGGERRRWREQTVASPGWSKVVGAAGGAKGTVVR
jgi:hypothetical protein